MNINAYRARTCGILLPWCLLISPNFPCWIFWGLEKDFVSQLSLTLRRPRFLALWRPRFVALWRPRFVIRQSVLLETYAVYLRFRRIYTTDSRSEAPNCIRFFADFGWWQNRGSPPNIFSSNAYTSMQHGFEMEPVPNNLPQLDYLTLLCTFTGASTLRAPINSLNT